MQPRVMITNGGAHPAEKHAETSAWNILQLVRIPEEPVTADNPDRASIEAGREAARQAKAVLEPLLAAIFVPHHAAVQDGERAALKNDGSARLAASSDEAGGHVDVDGVLAQVNALLATSPFAGHYAQPATQETVRGIIAAEFARSLGDERSYFADDPDKSPAAKAHHDKYFAGVKRDANDPHVKEFRAQRDR